MKSVQRAHVLVVAVGERRLMLAAQLRRMKVARASFVDSMEEARSLCCTGAADLCLVAIDDWAADAAPPAVIAPPGRDSGTPSLMIVEAVTPYMRRLARQSGYAGVVAAATAPRLMFRRMSAALQQKPGAARPSRIALRPPAAVAIPAEFGDISKFTRH